MSELELLDRVKNRDREAFIQFMKKYGPKLYSRMLTKLGERRLADAAFKETMIGFYKSLTENDGDDAVSSLLSGYAEEVSDRIGNDYFEDIIEKTADCAENSSIKRLNLPVPEVSAQDSVQSYAVNYGEKEVEQPALSKGAWIVTILILSLCTVIVVWIIIGLLVSMGTLPEINLGYTWFNNNIAEWF